MKLCPSQQSQVTLEASGISIFAARLSTDCDRKSPFVSLWLRIVRSSAYFFVWGKHICLFLSSTPAKLVNFFFFSKKYFSEIDFLG